MKIDSGKAPSLVISPGDDDRSSVNGNMADASWFSAALQAPEKKADTQDNQFWINKLADLTDTASSQSLQADRALVKASRSENPQDILNATRTLSSYDLKSQLNAKLIGKGVQSLEKLTNLQ